MDGEESVNMTHLEVCSCYGHHRWIHPFHCEHIRYGLKPFILNPLIDNLPLQYAKDKILMGAERKSAVIDEKNRRLVAFHEGGHALVAMHTDGAMPVHKATIMPRGRALGMVCKKTSVSWGWVRCGRDGFSSRVRSDWVYKRRWLIIASAAVWTTSTERV
jgi:hypothetical protein